MDDQLDLASIPIDDATGLLGRDVTRLYSARQDLDRVVDLYQVRVLGDPHVDVAEVRQKLDEQYLPDVRATEAAVSTSARAIAGRARTLMQVYASAPPLLSKDERVEAGALSQYLESACRDRPLRNLVDKVRAAVLAGDRATMYGFSQHLPARLAPVASDIGRGRDIDAREKQELGKLLGVITERLANPAFAVLKAKALEVLLQAEDLAGAAEKRGRAARLATRPFPWQSPSDVPWTGA